MIKTIPNAKPLTDAETIKALECCMSKSACKECPVPSDIADKFSCIPYLAENALNLINELKIECDKLVTILSQQAAENAEKDSKERGMVRVPVRIPNVLQIERKK